MEFQERFPSSIAKILDLCLRKKGYLLEIQEQEKEEKWEPAEKQGEKSNRRRDNSAKQNKFIKLMSLLKKFLTLLVPFLIFFFPAKINAFCPVCTVAVGAGVGLSRWLGIDDTVTGLWVGALTVSLIMWTINWLNQKKIKFIGRKIIITAAYYLLIVVPLFYTGIMGHPLNKLWGIDRLLIGIAVGSVAFLASVLIYDMLKKRNDGHSHFPFQKIAMPVGTLIILSLIFYVLTK